MKKIFSILGAIMLIVCLTVSTASVAYAAEPVEVTATRSTVIYPASGRSNGHFTGLNTGAIATYRVNGGNYHFDYFYDSSNYVGTIVISNGNYRVEKRLVGDSGSRSTESFYLPRGTYEVRIAADVGAAYIDKYYAFNLIQN